FRLGTAARGFPILIGALGPRMIDLAGQIADGLVLTMITSTYARAVVETFKRAAEASGRDSGGHEFVLACPVLLDTTEGLESIRRSFAAYGVIDVYNGHLRRQGFTREAELLREAWERKSRKAAHEAVGESMLQALSIVGDLASCRTQIEAYRSAGVTTLLLSPVSTASTPEAIGSEMLTALSRLATGLELL